MKNDYKDYTPEELRMHKSVTYYMQLVDYVMEQNDMQLDIQVRIL